MFWAVLLCSSLAERTRGLLFVCVVFADLRFELVLELAMMIVRSSVVQGQCRSNGTIQIRRIKEKRGKLFIGYHHNVGNKKIAMQVEIVVVCCTASIITHLIPGGTFAG
jgi:hypothetical protein